MFLLFNPHNLPGAQRYFITQYINFTNQIPTMQISNIYMLNILLTLNNPVRQLPSALLLGIRITDELIVSMVKLLSG